jgi:hypothetical protein
MRWPRSEMESIGIETVGEALQLGWTVIARCASGRREAMKSQRECSKRSTLDMETLVWTRGATFPLSRLESRLKCPRCGSRKVALIFDVPPTRIRMQAGARGER